MARIFYPGSAESEFTRDVTAAANLWLRSAWSTRGILSPMSLSPVDKNRCLRYTYSKQTPPCFKGTFTGYRGISRSFTAALCRCCHVEEFKTPDSINGIPAISYRFVKEFGDNRPAKHSNLTRSITYPEGYRGLLGTNSRTGSCVDIFFFLMKVFPGCVADAL